MSGEPLTELETATLVALFYATDGSIHARVPKQAVQSRFRRDLRGFVPKELKKLVRRGYALRNPSGRQMTFKITVVGISKLRQMKLI